MTFSFSGLNKEGYEIPLHSSEIIIKIMFKHEFESTALNLKNTYVIII